jgi:prophage regulatory protein
VKFINRKTVEAMTTLSRSAIYALMDKDRTRLYDPSFPRPRSLGPQKVAWVLSEVEEWMESRPVSAAHINEDDEP